jgi:hypothetical protein
MDETSRRVLQRFASSANKARMEPADWIRFCDMSIYIHHHALNVTGPEICLYLTQWGFSADAALRLGLQYERYRDLLAHYDGSCFSAAHA